MNTVELVYEKKKILLAMLQQIIMLRFKAIKKDKA
jgi:hypothetical protein